MKYMMLFIVLVAGSIVSGGCKSTTVVSNEKPITLTVSGAISLMDKEDSAPSPSTSVQNTVTVWAPINISVPKVAVEPREAASGFFSEIMLFLQTTVFKPAPQDPGMLGAISAHWILLSLMLGLLAYTAAHARVIREAKKGKVARNIEKAMRNVAKAVRKIEKEMRNASAVAATTEKGLEDAEKELEDVEKETGSPNDKLNANLNGLMVVEAALIVLSIVTFLRIIAPIFCTHAGEIGPGLIWLAVVLGLGSLALLLLCGIVKKQSKTVWLPKAAGIVFLKAGAVAFVAWMIPCLCPLCTRTAKQIDAFILAGFFVTVCLLSLLYVRQWWLYYKN